MAVSQLFDRMASGASEERHDNVLVSLFYSLTTIIQCSLQVIFKHWVGIHTRMHSEKWCVQKPKNARSDCPVVFLFLCGCRCSAHDLRVVIVVFIAGGADGAGGAARA